MSKVRSPTGDRGGGSCAGVARPASTGRQLAASDKHEHTTRDPHSRPSTVSRAGASDTAAVQLAHQQQATTLQLNITASSQLCHQDINNNTSNNMDAPQNLDPTGLY